MWEEWEAATTSNCKLSTLWYYINSYNLGYGNLHINVDGASIDQLLIKFCHWLSCPLNPRRLFQSVMILSGATGHTFDEYDQISHDMKDIMRTLQYWCGVDFLVQIFNDSHNKNQQFQGIHLQKFYNFQNGLNQIYLPVLRWKDDKHYPFKSKLDKPMAYSFGCTEVWNEQKQQTEKITHTHHFWTFIDGDIKNKNTIRKIRILPNDLDEIEWDLKLNENMLDEIPLQYQTKQDSIMTVEKYIPKHCNKKEAKRYYNYYKNVPCKPPNAKQQERINKNKKNGKLVKPAYLETVLNRRKAMKNIRLDKANIKDLWTVNQTEEQMKKNEKQNREKLAEELGEEWKEIKEDIEYWTGSQSDSDIDAQDENIVTNLIVRNRYSNRGNNNNNNNNNNNGNGCMIDSTNFRIHYNFSHLTLSQLKKICDEHSINYPPQMRNIIKLADMVRNHFQNNHW